MLKLKDQNKEVVSSHHSIQSFTLKLPQLMQELKDEIKEELSKTINRIMVSIWKSNN